MSVGVLELKASLERFTRGMSVPAVTARNAATETALAGGLDRAAKLRGLREANAQSAASAIRDADAAKRLTDSMREAILARNDASVQGQANSAPERILGLLE